MGRFAGSEQRRPVDMLTNIKATHGDLLVVWPLHPLSCLCAESHVSMNGITAGRELTSSYLPLLGDYFFVRVLPVTSLFDRLFPLWCAFRP